MGSLKTREKNILSNLNSKQIEQETLIALVEAVSLLNAINDKLDKFGGLDKVLVKLDSIADRPIQQVVIPSNSVIPTQTPSFLKTEEPAFIPSLNTDDMSVKSGSDSVKTSSKRRNLSGAAKNLKNITRSQEDG